MLLHIVTTNTNIIIYTQHRTQTHTHTFSFEFSYSLVAIAFFSAVPLLAVPKPFPPTLYTFSEHLKFMNILPSYIYKHTHTHTETRFKRTHPNIYKIINKAIPIGARITYDVNIIITSLAFIVKNTTTTKSRTIQFLSHT